MGSSELKDTVRLAEIEKERQKQRQDANLKLKEKEIEGLKLKLEENEKNREHHITVLKYAGEMQRDRSALEDKRLNVINENKDAAEKLIEAGTEYMNAERDISKNLLGGKLSSQPSIMGAITN